MLAAGYSRVWILPPHLPHTRVRAGGYLPIPPLAGWNPCKRVPTPIRTVSYAHSSHSSPTPPPPPPLSFPLATCCNSLIRRRVAATPLLVRSRRRSGCCVPPPMHVLPLSFPPGIAGAAAARHARRKTIVIPLRPRPRGCRCSWTCWGAPCAPPSPPAPPAPTVAPPPLRTLLVRRERSLAAVRPSAVRVARALHALLRCPRTGGSSVRLLQCSTYPLPRHGGAAAGALPKALWLLRSSAPAHAATLLPPVSVLPPVGVARCTPKGTPMPAAEALLLVRSRRRFGCCAPPPMTCWRWLHCPPGHVTASLRYSWDARYWCCSILAARGKCCLVLGRPASRTSPSAAAAARPAPAPARSSCRLRPRCLEGRECISAHRCLVVDPTGGPPIPIVKALRIPPNLPTDNTFQRQTVTGDQMRDPAGTKHMPEQPHPTGRREQRANGPRALVSQPLHGSRPELAATTRAQHERPNTSSFHVLAPGGCGASGSPRPPIAAQTAPHASSAVTAGWVAGLLRVGRGRSPS